MATRWLKLEGETADIFNTQYQVMLDEHADEFSPEEFPPEMFVRYLLDVRQKSMEMEQLSIDMKFEESDEDGK